MYLLIVRLVTFLSPLFIKQRKFTNKSLKNARKSILALPYYPENFPGSKERIAAWKEYFESENIEFNIHWVSNETEYLNSISNNNPFLRYNFFIKVLFKRIILLKSLHTYDAIWIQRSFIPYYPFKKSYLEKKIKKHGNIIYDFYDADYTSNFQLTIQIFKYAHKITVASDFLERYVKKYNANVFNIPFSFDFKKYKQKNYSTFDRIVIGWMGSPENFNAVYAIENQLIEIENKFPFVEFSFICRAQPKIGLKRLTFHKWNDLNFNYNKIINNFDIGLNPVTEENDINMAKVSFKCLEYMSLGIAFVTSPIGIPNGIVNHEHAIIVEKIENWSKSITELINNIDNIKSLGMNARKLIEKKYNYSLNYNYLKNTLIN